MSGGEDDIQAILFDVGGVLVTSRPDPSRIARLLGLDPSAADAVELVDHAIWFHRDSYDIGLDDREFWNRVAGDCGLGEIDDVTLHSLVVEDTSRFETPDPGAVAVAHQLHATKRLGILSNAPVAVANAVESQRWARELFESFTFSGPLGTAKPSQAIYRAGTEAIGVPAQRILFIDDRAPNLRAAELAGMTTLQWTGAEEVGTELIDRGILISATAA